MKKKQKTKQKNHQAAADVDADLRSWEGRGRGCWTAATVQTRQGGLLQHDGKKQVEGTDTRLTRK